MEREKQWYIIYTHAGNELKTLYALRKKHIECFCPTITVEKQKQKGVVTPVLPNYIFVQISPEDRVMIKQKKGVLNFMYWLGEYVIVKNDDITILKELTEKCQCLTAENIKINTTLSTTKIWKTVPVENNKNSTMEEDFIKVSFPAYGFAITAKESQMNVRVIDMSTNRGQQKVVDIQYIQ